MQQDGQDLRKPDSPKSPPMQRDRAVSKRFACENCELQAKESLRFVYAGPSASHRSTEYLRVTLERRDC